MGKGERRMTDENALMPYYLDIEEELRAREAFPECDQNKKRIIECKRELKNIRSRMGEG